MWAADAIAPAGMDILCIALRYRKSAKFRVNNNRFLNVRVEKCSQICQSANIMRLYFNVLGNNLACTALIRAMDDTEEYEMISCVRCYHIYQLIWDASVGEMLQCKSERHNSHDRYAISVTKNENTVGHLPKNYLGCALFF